MGQLKRTKKRNLTAIVLPVAIVCMDSSRIFFLNFILVELFFFSVARSNALPETAGLHGETPSSRYCVTTLPAADFNGAHEPSPGNPRAF